MPGVLKERTGPGNRPCPRELESFSRVKLLDMYNHIIPLRLPSRPAAARGGPNHNPYSRGGNHVR